MVPDQSDAEVSLCIPQPVAQALVARRAAIDERLANEEAITAGKPQ